MFRIIGSDQRLYGPVGAEIIRQWIAEGRVNASTVIQLDGTVEWKPLSAFPEFATGGPPPVNSGFQAPPSRQQQPPPLESPQSAQYPAAPADVNNLATLGFVFGLLSVFCCCSFPLSVLGLILSIVALNRANRLSNGEGKNFAIAGLILSILGLSAGISLPLLGLLSHPHGSWLFRW